MMRSFVFFLISLKGMVNDYKDAFQRNRVIDGSTQS